MKNGPTKFFAMPNDHQDSKERRQRAIPRMEIGRVKKGWGKTKKGEIFLKREKVM